MIRQVEFFEKAGKSNTEACVAIVKKMVLDEQFEHVVVASTSGATAKSFSEALADTGINLVVITHSAGFKETNAQESDESIKKQVEAFAWPPNTI